MTFIRNAVNLINIYRFCLKMKCITFMIKVNAQRYKSFKEAF